MGAWRRLVHLHHVSELAKWQFQVLTAQLANSCFFFFSLFVNIGKYSIFSLQQLKYSGFLLPHNKFISLGPVLVEREIYLIRKQQNVISPLLAAVNSIQRKSISVGYNFANFWVDDFLFSKTERDSALIGWTYSIPRKKIRPSFRITYKIRYWKQNHQPRKMPDFVSWFFSSLVPTTHVWWKKKK